MAELIRSTGSRVAIFVIAAIALASVSLGLALLITGPTVNWSIALIGIVCAAALEVCWIRVGSVRHRIPVISLPVLALPALLPVVPEAVAIGVIALGVMSIILVRTLEVRVALYSAGLATTGAVLSLGVSLLLREADVSEITAMGIACGVYAAFIIVVEVVRIRLTKGKPDLEGHRMLSLSRIALSVVGAAGVGAGVSSCSEIGVPFINDGGGGNVMNAIVVLLALTAAAVGVKLPVQMITMRRRLKGLIAGSSALSASNRNAKKHLATNSRTAVTDAEAAKRLGRKLCRVVADTIGVESVEVRNSPPRPGEIGVPVSLTKGIRQYVVAKRDAMDGAFTIDDRRCLIALARTADIVAEGRHNIGGLTLRAKTDSLTLLPNYGAFQEALANINDNRDYAEAIAVLFIDLDDFKRLNDTHGHQVGDEVLRELGRRLTAAVRPYDVVARVGGDEFVIILTQLSELDDARIVAGRIMDKAGAQLVIGDLEFSPVLSIGLAYSAYRETDLKQLVEDADRAMLAIKRSRRNSRQGGGARASSLNIADHRSFELNDIVVRAIEANELKVAFQPIVNLVTGHIWAFEALVRYTHPKRGPIAPSTLIEKAKALDRMDVLTIQVAEQAMAAALRIRQIDRQIVCMTINIDAPQVLPGRLGTYFQELAGRFPDISICLELNEGSLSMVSEPVRAETEHLRDLGIMIAVDDYGSQDSSVDSLVRVPMDILKIDRSLIDDLDDIRQREVLTALQGFGDKLEYSMIVEGVENQAMADHLTVLGIRNAQGFHYGVPQFIDDILARLEAHGAAAVVPTDEAALASTLE